MVVTGEVLKQSRRGLTFKKTNFSLSPLSPPYSKLLKGPW